ncbi:MAG TPA: hypothetical protein VFX96_01555 [Pyrinomonadaceae bacterium]|nr:hypothetical protein [Pyrinomonadaceae bacterium]
MRTRHFIRKAAPLLLLAALSLPAQALREPDPTPSASQTTAAQSSIIFSVEKYAEGSIIIDPIVVVRGGRFSQPPGGMANDGTPQGQRAEEEFVREFYRPGREYRLVFGGGEAGKARVVKYEEQGGVGMVASATLETPVRLGGQVDALATDSTTFGRGTGTRRAPSTEERAAAIALAQKILGQKRVPRSAVARMEVNNLTAVDTDGDGRHELIGSFIIMGGYGAEYALFLIATRGAGARLALTPALAWFKHGGSDNTEYRSLVDVLDVDSDGVAEVFIRSTYYEAHDYSIYKRSRGAWRVVYTGAGGGI